MAWMSLEAGRQYLVEALGIELKRVPVFLDDAAQSGVRTQATIKGGVPLDIPEKLSATLWASQPENPIRLVTRVFGAEGVVGFVEELQAELGDYSGIQFCPEDLRRRYPPTGTALPADATPATAAKRRAGRTGDFPWHEFFGEFLLMVHEGGIARSDGEMMRRLRDLLLEKGYKVPSTEYFEERVRIWLRPYRARVMRADD